MRKTKRPSGPVPKKLIDALQYALAQSRPEVDPGAPGGAPLEGSWNRMALQERMQQWDTDVLAVSLVVEAVGSNAYTFRCRCHQAKDTGEKP